MKTKFQNIKDYYKELRNYLEKNGIITLIWIKVIKFGIRIRKNSYILGTGICSSIVTIFVICNLSFGVFQAWWMSIIAFIFLISFQSTKYEQ